MKADLAAWLARTSWARVRVLAGVLGALLTALGLLSAWPAGPLRAATAPVSVFPIPGGRLASPQTQITFRGVPAAQLGAVTITGSKSRGHAGRILADSDGDGGSFVPSAAFAPGERVTVRTGLNIIGGQRGSYSFTIARPAGRIGFGGPKGVPRVRGDVKRFASRRDLVPPAVTVTHLPRHAEPGDLFLAGQQGPVQDGPMILGPYGGLIWFQPVPRGQSATDFRVQTLGGQSVLTWWQGRVSAAGTGSGVGEIYSTAYRHLATVRAGNGLTSDLHEFQLTPQGTALVTAYYPVQWETGSGRRAKRRIVLDSVVQEIDLPTGLVLYQWDSLDHVSTADSHQPFPSVAGHPWDYFHINSIQEAPNGSLLVSSRDTWAAYDLDHRTGKTIWTLGGRRSSFRMGPNTTFAFQHDIRIQAGNQVTVFDDGAGPPAVHRQSRGLTLGIDFKRRRVSLKGQDEHRPSLLAFYEGNAQRLSNGDEFLGWGQQPYMTEFNPRGQTVFDARFVGANSSYRAYRFPWSGQPAGPPALATRVSGGRRTVYASWNGSNHVYRWRVLGGASVTTLKPVASALRGDFETAIGVPHPEAYVSVQALDRRGRVLSTSDAARLG